MTRTIDTIFLTGGASHCGSRLVPQLPDLGYKVTIYDVMFFGSDFLPTNNPNLRLIQGDIRDTAKMAAAIPGHQVFISLACISNDASFELDEKLSTSVNLDAFEPMVMAAKKAGVQRFIYASSSSVYGVSDKPNVTEDHPLPVSLYNKYKGMCELLFASTPTINSSALRSALRRFGYAASTLRPVGEHPHQPCRGRARSRCLAARSASNLHVQDYATCRSCSTAPTEFRTRSSMLSELSLMEIAQPVQSVVSRNSRKGKSRSSRHPTTSLSYHINSDKITRTLASSRSNRERCGGALRRVPRRAAAEQHGRRSLLQCAPAEEASGRMNGKDVAVVTGGAGFIGSHMVDVLLDRGLAVRVIDNLTGGHRNNLQHLAGRPDLECHWEDIRGLKPGSPVFNGVRYVFHFAGIGDIVPSIERPIDYMDVNVQGTVHVLECARTAGAEKLSTRRRRPATDWRGTAREDIRSSHNALRAVGAKAGRPALAPVSLSSQFGLYLQRLRHPVCHHRGPVRCWGCS